MFGDPFYYNLTVYGSKRVCGQSMIARLSAISLMILEIRLVLLHGTALVQFDILVRFAFDLNDQRNRTKVFFSNK